MNFIGLFFLFYLIDSFYEFHLKNQEFVVEMGKPQVQYRGFQITRVDTIFLRSQIFIGPKCNKQYLRSKVGKLWPVGQMWPLPFFCKWSCIGTQPLLFLYILSVAVLPLQSWVSAAGIVWPVNLRCLPSGPLWKKFLDLCFRWWDLRDSVLFIESIVDILRNWL